MRFYDYLSVSKIDMLYSQISDSSRSAGGEIGVDLKLIKMSRKTDRTKPVPIHEKLAAVEEWIYAHEPVGNLEKPDVWIYGRTKLLATTLTITDQDTGQTVDGPVLFTPAQDLWPKLLMGGSSHHLMAKRPYPDMSLPAHVRFYSWPVTLLSTLSEFADDLGIASVPEGFGRRNLLLERLMRQRPGARRPPERKDAEVITGLVNWIHLSSGNSADRRRPVGGRGSESRTAKASLSVQLGECEFLAKRLQTESIQSGGTTVQATLATPLFVALFD